MANKGIKYRIYPTVEQEQQLLQEVGNQRFLWNSFLSKQISLYERKKKFKFYGDMQDYLVYTFKDKHEFLRLGSSKSLQQTLRDLEKALKDCYKLGFGFPKFKEKGKKDSFRVPQSFTVGRRSITVPKIGIIKINKSCSLNGKPKNLTISKDINGKWYVSVCVEFEPKPLKKTDKLIGIDLGTVRLATSSKNHIKKSFKEVKYVRELNRQIKTKQRELSRKELKSSNWLKAKATLQKLHLKLRNMRQNRLHKFSTMLVTNFDTIVVEDLKTKNMTRSAKGTLKKPGKNVKQKSGLNRSILKEGWYILIHMLAYKCDWYGKEFIRVDPKFTSQICSSCGFKSKKNRKSQSKFECQKCGFKINADHNAAKNILTRGLALAA